MQHREICPAVIVKCESCGRECYRKHYAEHIDVCPKIDIQCPNRWCQKVVRNAPDLLSIPLPYSPLVIAPSP